MTLVEFEQLVTGADVARLLGLSRERVRQLAQRDDFPKPLGRLGGAVVWTEASILTWRDRHRP